MDRPSRQLFSLGPRYIVDGPVSACLCICMWVNFRDKKINIINKIIITVGAWEQAGRPAFMGG